MNSATARILSIVGMHRSGTSLITNWLASCGLYIGDDLIPSHPTNLAGHFEDKSFVRLHRRILAENKVDFLVTRHNSITVNSKYFAQAKELVHKNRKHAQWGWKDPRTALFLEFWKSIQPGLKILAVYRPFTQVVDSLLRREPLRPEIKRGVPNGLRWTLKVKYSFFNVPLLRLFLCVWDHYNNNIISFARKYPHDCLVIRIDDPAPYSRQIIDFMKREWNFSLEHGSLRDIYVPGLLKVDLLKGKRVLLSLLYSKCLDTYRKLEELRRQSLQRLS